MNIFELIKAQQLDARKARNTIKVNLLTTLIGDLTTASKNTGNSITDTAVVALLKKYQENAKFTLTHSSLDVVATTELVILGTLVPAQLTDLELDNIITASLSKLITNGHQKTQKLMGAIMAELKLTVPGLYDGRVASTKIKVLLA